MKRIIYALTIMLVCLSSVFVSCNSNSPTPTQEDNKTELDKVDDAISAASDAFNGIKAETDESGNIVYKITTPVTSGGITVNSGTKTVSENGLNRLTVLNLSYEENGQNISVETKESTDITKSEDINDSVATSLLEEAKSIPVSEFMRIEDYKYEYTKPVETPEFKIKAVESISIDKVEITFKHENNKSSYTYEITSGENVITETASKSVTMTKNGNEVALSEELKSEFSLSSIQGFGDIYYSVSFKIDNEIVANKMVKSGNSVQEPVIENNAPSTPYLKGWYTDEELTNSYNFTSPVTEDITLYAKRISKDDLELTFWTMWNEQESEGAIFKKAAKAFEEETGVKINIKFIGRDIGTKILPALQSGENIDIFDTNAYNIANDYAAYCQDLTPYIDEDYKNHSYQVFRNMNEIWAERKQVSLAELPNIGGVFYDKDKFEKAGITVDGTPSWGEFLAMCEKLKVAGYEPLALDATYADFYFGYHLERYIGEDDIINLSLNGGWSDNEAVINAAEDIIDFVNKGYLADGAPDDYPTSQNKIGSEDVTMVVCADYVTSEVNKNTNREINWGYFNYPIITNDKGGTGKQNIYGGANGFAVTSKCIAPEIAFEFIETIITGKTDQERVNKKNSIPADPTNSCYLDGAVEALKEAEKTVTWTMGLNANTVLKNDIKNIVIELYSGKFETGEEFAAALDELY